MKHLIAIAALALAACGPPPVEDQKADPEVVACCACLLSSEFQGETCLDAKLAECTTDVKDGLTPGLARCWQGGDHCSAECGAIFWTNQ